MQEMWKKTQTKKMSYQWKNMCKLKGQNHYARICLGKKKGQGVHTVQDDTDDSDDLSEKLFIKMVSHYEDDSGQSSKTNNTGQAVNRVTDDKWTTSLLVNGEIVTFKKLTGSMRTISRH